MTEVESGTELFELSVYGGAIERRFRAKRPGVDGMAWGSFSRAGYTDEELVAARTGWSDLAVQEYAAAASQANVVRLLVRARAPVDLSAMLATFPVDELAHTELCVRMAEELGGVTPIAYRTGEVFPEPHASRSEDAAATAEHPLAEAARAVAWEFCVGETLSHGLLAFHHRHARDPLLRAVWGRLARDEATHARFGWLFLEWARPLLSAAERSSVSATIEDAIAHVDGLDAKVLGLGATAFVDVGVFGSQGREAYLHETRRLLEERVVPRLHEFL